MTKDVKLTGALFRDAQDLAHDAQEYLAGCVPPEPWTERAALHDRLGYHAGFLSRVLDDIDACGWLKEPADTDGPMLAGAMRRARIALDRARRADPDWQQGQRVLEAYGLA